MRLAERRRISGEESVVKETEERWDEIGWEGFIVPAQVALSRASVRLNFFQPESSTLTSKRNLGAES